MAEIQIDYHFWLTLAVSIVAVILTWRQLKLSERLAPATKNEGQGRRRWYGNWPVVALLVLAISGWIAFLLDAPTVDYFAAWGIRDNPLRINVTVDGHKLIGKKPDEVMVIARASNLTVDHLRDTTIVRSGTYKIFDGRFSIEAEFKEDEFGKAALKYGGVEYYLLLVPPDFPLESVHDLADAEKLGAKIIGAKAAR